MHSAEVLQVREQNSPNSISSAGQGSLRARLGSALCKGTAVEPLELSPSWDSVSLAGTEGEHPEMGRRQQTSSCAADVGLWLGWSRHL